VIDRVRHLPMLAVVTFRPGFAVPWENRSHTACLPLARPAPGRWSII
jgi:hypothetical protein